MTTGDPRISHTMTVDGITSTRRHGGHIIHNMIKIVTSAGGAAAQRWNPRTTVNETAWLTHGIVVDAHTGTANAMIPLR